MSWQQLQSGHLAGGQEKKTEWPDTDHDYEESLDRGHPNGIDTEGYDDEYFAEETDWTDNYYETSDYDDNDNTFSEHSPAVETQEGDTSKLEWLRRTQQQA